MLKWGDGMARKHFFEFEAIMKRMEEETNDTGRNVIHINTIQRLLRDTPTVDAVPVVRCKDCICWGTGESGETEYIKHCFYNRFMVNKDGYCVYGEKKVEE